MKEMYNLPPVDLLCKSEDAGVTSLNVEEMEYIKRRITEILKSFGIEICSISATIGPVVTLYEITPERGVRISKIRGLEDDIALSLKAIGVRVIAPMLGRGTIGIEVPNLKPCQVRLRDVVETPEFQETDMELPVAVGRTATGTPFVADLAAMPHLLVGGATGQGKTVFLNCLIVSLLYKKRPEELKFVLMDPKGVEFGIYERPGGACLARLPHGGCAVVTDADRALEALHSLCAEMDSRHKLLQEAGAGNLKEYNALHPDECLPYIVVVIDEFCDLILTAGREVERLIVRIAQSARAVGIHMVIATQRPTANIITGTVKANFPARAAFRVMSSIDSTIILDRTGANQLMGKGDMLFLHGNEPVRVQCAFVDIGEVRKITEYIDSNMPDEKSEDDGHLNAYFLPEVVYEKKKTELDTLFEEASEYIRKEKDYVSVGVLQKRFAIGHNRATRLLEQLKLEGVITDEGKGKNS